MKNKFLHDFCRKYNFPEEAERAFADVSEKIFRDKKMSEIFERNMKAYETSHETPDIDKYLEEIVAAAAEFDAPSETVELLFFLYLAEPLRKIYAEKKLPEKYYDNIMIDMRSKVMECHNVKKIWGTFVSPWFTWFFGTRRFAIGRLQYEMDAVSPRVSPDGKYVFRGDKAVTVHIPSLGPLKVSDVRDSMKEAAEFFADEFEGDEVLFICESWLLYPAHFRILSPESGIRKFMDEFTIISSKTDKAQHDMWRIFGTFDTDREKWPQDTSLQRIYKSWLDEGNPIGEGFGIRYIKKEKA